MKKIFLVLSCCSFLVAQTITVSPQVCGNVGGGATVSTVPVSVRAGDVADVFVSFNGNGQGCALATASVKNSEGMVFTALTPVSNAAYVCAQKFRLLNSPANTSEVFTVTMSRAVGNLTISAAAISNAVPDVDMFTSAAGQASPIKSAPFTTTAPGLIVANVANYYTGSLTTTGSGYTLNPIGGGSCGTSLVFTNTLVQTTASALTNSVASFTAPSSYSDILISAYKASGAVVQAPTVSLSASPNTIQAGQAVTLSWSSTNATAVSISGIGNVSLSGSVTVNPTVTTTYIATATGPGGTVTSNATVTVTQPPPSVSFTANPVSILTGQSSALTWSVVNATSVSIDQGVGTVGASGTISVFPTATTTYTLTATGSGGTQTASVTINVSVQSGSVMTVGMPSDPYQCTFTKNTGSVSVTCLANGVNVQMQTINPPLGKAQIGGVDGSIVWVFQQPTIGVYSYQIAGPTGTATTGSF